MEAAHDLKLHTILGVLRSRLRTRQNTRSSLLLNAIFLFLVKLNYQTQDDDVAFTLTKQQLEPKMPAKPVSGNLCDTVFSRPVCGAEFTLDSR